MRPITPVIILATLAASACATPPVAPGSETVGQNDNDCAVIAAVAREHYRFGPDSVPPPLWLDAEGSDWAPRCDWARYGVSFPRIHVPTVNRHAAQPVQWVSFRRPTYDGNGATVETGILHGPLAGMGNECRVVSGFAGWTVAECRGTWIS